jgi:hypothetical protein
MDLYYGITCRRNNPKKPPFAFLHFYDVRPAELLFDSGEA